MILTGDEIKRMVASGQIVIEPFNAEQVEPNSYGCRLGDTLLEYSHLEVDSRHPPKVITHKISSEGFVLLPGKFYLGVTAERIGGISFASELYSNLSSALNGIFMQTSAPLGHTGAVIHWTLEITVAQAVRIYPNAKLIKVCFWSNHGNPVQYSGRYQGARTVIPSRIFEDQR